MLSPPSSSEICDLGLGERGGVFKGARLGLGAACRQGKVDVRAQPCPGIFPILLGPEAWSKLRAIFALGLHESW